MTEERNVGLGVKIFIVAPKTKAELDALADRSVGGEINGLTLEASINLVASEIQYGINSNIQSIYDSFGRLYLGSGTLSPEESSALESMRNLFLKNCGDWSLWTLEKLQKLHEVYQKNALNKVRHCNNFPCFHVGFEGDSADYKRTQKWEESRVIHGPDKGRKLIEIFNEFNAIPETIYATQEILHECHGKDADKNRCDIFFSIRLSYPRHGFSEPIKKEEGMFGVDTRYSKEKGFHFC